MLEDETKVHYAVAPAFSDRQFPFETLPESWKRATSSETFSLNEEKDKSWSSIIVPAGIGRGELSSRDVDECRRLIVPQTEKEWYYEN